MNASTFCTSNLKFQIAENQYADYQETQAAELYETFKASGDAMVFQTTQGGAKKFKKVHEKQPVIASFVDPDTSSFDTPELETQTGAEASPVCFELDADVDTEAEPEAGTDACNSRIAGNEAEAVRQQHALLNRLSLITRIRSEIRAGVYETPEKLDIVAERLLAEVG